METIPEATGTVTITRTPEGEWYDWHDGSIIWVSYELLATTPKEGDVITFGPFKLRCIGHDSPRHFVALERIDS